VCVCVSLCVLLPPPPAGGQRASWTNGKPPREVQGVHRAQKCQQTGGLPGREPNTRQFNRCTTAPSDSPCCSEPQHFALFVVQNHTAHVFEAQQAHLRGRELTTSPPPLPRLSKGRSLNPLGSFKRGSQNSRGSTGGERGLSATL
jgi:hypothetical protein